jgi:hypothetical protein
MSSALERALDEKRAPWTIIEYRTKDFWVFRDAYAVTPGHLLFVPTEEHFDNIIECYKAAYKFGAEGVVSEYAHNKSLMVKEGQSVTKGQQIAEMGNTDSDNVKLHFEMRQLGKPVDPASLLPAR